MQLDRAGELYRAGNVTYRGVEVGRVSKVHLTDTGVEAVLSLKSGIQNPGRSHRARAQCVGDR